MISVTFPILKGIFSKWYCPNCNTIMRRKDVKYQSDFKGLYTLCWFRCLKCKNTNVRLLNEEVESIVLSNRIKQ